MQGNVGVVALKPVPGICSMKGCTSRVVSFWVCEAKEWRNRKPPEMGAGRFRRSSPIGFFFFLNNN